MTQTGGYMFATYLASRFQAPGGQVNQRVVRLGITANGDRSTQLEC